MINEHGLRFDDVLTHVPSSNQTWKILENPQTNSITGGS